MSLERRERRRCNMCGEIISGNYYSCESKYHVATEEYVAVAPTYWTNINLGGGVCTPPPTLDVCLDCWEKMGKK